MSKPLAEPSDSGPECPATAPIRRPAIGRPLQIMYGVGGEQDLTERELPQLAGWRGNRPVRIGNGAWDQHQLDVYGELLDAVHGLRDQIGELDDAQRRFLVSVADAAAAA